MNRFSVLPLHALTRDLAAVAAFRRPPDTVITGARILSVYTDRVLGENREILIPRRANRRRRFPAGRCQKRLGSAIL